MKVDQCQPHEKFWTARQSSQVVNWVKTKPRLAGNQIFCKHSKPLFSKKNFKFFEFLVNCFFGTVLCFYLILPFELGRLKKHIAP